MKKKVLLVAPYGGIAGGISRWTSHIVDFYNHYGKDDCSLELVSTGRTTFVNANTPIWKRLWIARIDYRKIFKDFNYKIKAKYDVMHLTSSGGLSLYKDLYMIRKAKKYGSKCIIHFHFGRIPELAKKNNREWKMVRKVVSEVDKAIVIDRKTYETLVSHGFENIVLMPNPFASAVEKIISDNPDISRQKHEILFTGHVKKTKGIFELLQACSDIDGIHLTVVGYVLAEVQQEIESMYGSPQWLTICGEKPYEEVIKEMMRCDIFVLPTYTEGFPNVILEAMAAGCAIVSTPVGAIPQMLEDDDRGKYGVLVAPRNVYALRKALVSLLDNETLKRELRLNVSRRVRERYNISSIWNKMVAVWQNC